MKKMLSVFLICFTFSFGGLYLLAGRIFASPPQSPVKSRNSQENITNLTMGKHKLKLCEQHVVEKGNYYRYREDSQKRIALMGISGDAGSLPQVEFEIHFKRLMPFAKKQLQLVNPKCVYYSEKSIGKMKTPRRFEITAREGILEQGEKQFTALILSGDVMVKGYDKNRRQVAILATDALHVDFANRAIDTERAVEFKQSEAIEIKGTGMRGNMNLDRLTLLHENTLVIMSGIWQAASEHKKRIYFEKIISRCDGPSDVQYDKDNFLLQVSQAQNVRMKSEQARLLCEKVDFCMKKTGKNWEMQEFKARENVQFYDGEKECRNFASGGYFRLRYLSGEQDERVPEITIRDRPRIIIRDFGGFSLVEPQKRPRLANRQQNLDIGVLDASCEDSLKWMRIPLDSGQRESFTFFKNVRLHEISQDGKKRTLTGDRACLITESQRDGPRRMPISLKAVGSPVIIKHERGLAKGEQLLWRRLSDMESKATLSGKKPHLELKEVTLGTEPGFFQGAASLTQNVPASPPKRTKQVAKEDLHISSRKPMELYALETPYGNGLYGCASVGKAMTAKSIHPGPALRYRACGKVRINRYRSGTDERRGDIRCEKMVLFLRKPASKVTGGQAAKNDVPKMEVKSLLATGKVRFTSPEINGGGRQLVVNGKKSALLTGNAWLENDDGKLSARKFFYDSGREMFLALGKVKLKSPDARARGDILRYYKKTGMLQLTGNPAIIKQLKKDGSQNHSIEAGKIRYWREQGKVRAKKDVVLTLTSNEKSRRLLTEQFPGVSEENSKSDAGEKESRYRLVSQFLKAKIDPEQRSVSSFEARRGVYIEKLLSPGDDKTESARGDRIEYRDKKGCLYGRPAEIRYANNRISGRKLRFDAEKQLAICEKPERVILSDVGNNVDSGLGGSSKERNSPVEITCKEPIRFDRKSNEIEFSDQVEVKMSQGKLFCETLKVFLKDRKAARMIAHRKVKFISGDHIVTADRLDWDEKADMAFVTGYPHVKLVSSRFTMTSPVVWYHIKSRRFFTRGRDISLEKLPER